MFYWLSNLKAIVLAMNKSLIISYNIGLYPCQLIEFACFPRASYAFVYSYAPLVIKLFAEELIKIDEGKLL